MWEISNGLQIFGFLRAVFLGGAFCLVYDILRAVRKLGVNSDFAVFIQDVLYFVFITPITFCFLLALTNGELRAYFFVGVILGFIIIRITVSVLFLKVYLFIFSAFIKVFVFIKRVLNTVFNCFSKVFTAFYVVLRKKSIKIAICFKKLLKKQ